MANRAVVTANLLVNGKPVSVSLIDNPLIDDVLITEARIQAASIINQDPSLVDNRRVSKDIRDFLIRTGVER